MCAYFFLKLIMDQDVKEIMMSEGGSAQAAAAATSDSNSLEVNNCHYCFLLGSAFMLSYFF